MGSTKGLRRAGRLEFYDGTTHERVSPLAPVVFYDDFIGAGNNVVPDSASIESGMNWVKEIVGAAPPTVAGSADAANGTIACTLTSASQAQTAALNMADQRQFSLEQGCIFECRVRASVLPTLVAENVFGLVGDALGVAPDTMTYSAFFTMDGSGEIFCETDDNATDNSVTSGVTATAAQWKIYRIDATDVTDIKFYIDGAEVAAGTTFGYAATGANAILQPYLGCYKASGAGVGTLLVDYVRIWQNRS